MSMDVLRAVIQGYSDRMFDMQLLTVHQGYWSGYFNKARKPKSLESLLKKMLNARNKKERKNSGHPHAEDVDVAAFLEREHKRKLLLKNKT